MGKADEQLLQRYFDGELSAEERARVEARLDDEDQLRLAALAEVRELMRDTLSAEADAADLDLWSALEKQLPPANDLEAARRKRELPRWMRSRFTSISAGITALAAAAVLVVMFRPWHAQHSGNDCDILSLETSGAMATVMQIQDAPHGGDGPTTVIWTEEQD